MPYVRALSIALLLPLGAAAQNSPGTCEPAPAVAAAISRVEALRLAGVKEVCTQGPDMMRAIIREYPDDVFSHLEFLFFQREKGHDDIITEYRSAIVAHPGDRRLAARG